GRFREYAQLVAARQRIPPAEIPLRNGARTFREEAQRTAELLREHHSKSQRRQQREQERQCQRHRVKALQSRARKRDFLIVAIAPLDLFHVLLQLFRDRLDYLQETQRLQWVRTVDRHDDAKHPPLVRYLFARRIKLG